MKRNRFHYGLLVFALSLVSAYICPAAFVFALGRSFPREDLAFGQSFLQTMDDPFIFGVAWRVATIVGCFVFPVAL